MHSWARSVIGFVPLLTAVFLPGSPLIHRWSARIVGDAEITSKYGAARYSSKSNLRSVVPFVAFGILGMTLRE
jgi:hypothetical protein